MTQPEFEQAVVKTLNAYGLIYATYEHPGYISIPLREGLSWAFGTLNNYWEGDLVEADGADAGSHIALGIPDTYRVSPELIAGRIISAIHKKGAELAAEAISKYLLTGMHFSRPEALEQMVRTIRLYQPHA